MCVTMAAVSDGASKKSDDQQTNSREFENMATNDGTDTGTVADIEAR